MPAEKPVYAWKMREQIVQAVKDLADLYFSKMPLILTNDEVVSALIEPDHVPKLRELEEMVGFVGNTQAQSAIYIDTEERGPARVSLRVVFQSRPPVILPKYIANGLAAGCPEPVRQKISAWAQERHRAGQIFVDTIAAFTLLNQNCDSVDALVRMMPCFPLIYSRLDTSENSKAQSRAQKLAASKRVPPLPQLPRAVKDRIIQVSAEINAVSLILDAPTPMPTRTTALCFSPDISYEPNTSSFLSLVAGI